MRVLTFPGISRLIYVLFLIVLISVYANAQTGSCPPEEKERANRFDGSGRRTESCYYKNLPAVAGSDHEPPIGVGGGSFFFDLPEIVLLERDGGKDVNGYYTYKIAANPKIVPNPHAKYTEILSVLVMTEEIPMNPHGEVTLFRYDFAEGTKAELRLWLAKQTPAAPLSSTPDVIIRGSEGQMILSKEKLKGESVGKMLRKNRFFHSKGALRVVKWQMTGPGVPANYGDFGDDLYYFYITFDH